MVFFILFERPAQKYFIDMEKSSLWMKDCILGCDTCRGTPCVLCTSWNLKWTFLITCCPASIHLSACLSVCKHFTSFSPLNQTWNKASFSEGHSNLHKWRNSLSFGYWFIVVWNKNFVYKIKKSKRHFSQGEKMAK